MSDTPEILPDDPTALQAMILALQAENARMDADITKMAATLRAHEVLVQALHIQIARRKKQKVRRQLVQRHSDLALGRHEELAHLQLGAVAVS